MSENLSEESLERVIAELRQHAGDPRLVLRPTTMLLRGDLTENQIALAHQWAEYFAGPSDA